MTPTTLCYIDEFGTVWARSAGFDDRDIPAIAVPLTLFDDAEFGEAVRDRALGFTDATRRQMTVEDVIAAMTAELQSRVVEEFSHPEYEDLDEEP